MEKPGLFQQKGKPEQRIPAAISGGLLDTDAIAPERDEGFWQKLENRATEKAYSCFQFRLSTLWKVRRNKRVFILS